MGLGYDPLVLVKDAIERSNSDDFDQVWCVFDRDDVAPDVFNQALHQAEAHNKRNKQKIRIAYSNQAFELWFLLHFHYADSALARPDYIVRLDELLDERYQKNDREMYRKLLARQATAIRNAERLLSQYDPVNPVADDPSTTVHLLVQELNRFVQHKRLS